MNWDSDGNLDIVANASSSTGSQLGTFIWLGKGDGAFNEPLFMGRGW
jgi:hypothetical protein